MDDKLFYEWSYSIEVDYRNHSTKDIIMILEKISHRGFFRNAKHFTYHYSDQYETTFLDGNQSVRVVSHAHYNCSESKNIMWEF
ncbi:MAG: hypothetical protein GF365_01065 [Candidatus Buchananbacteria bacterium]|nr:hypothetical protein [Candidatus Buchananbacteria bacterium]